MAGITVFISYAREDLRQATEIRQFVLARSFAVWMDVFDILPGELWDIRIQHGLRTADFVLLCLSERSVSKRGYLQREVKKAVDLATEMLDNDIYLLPVRIDPCELPSSLSGYQWVDYYRDDGPSRLIAALIEGARRRGLDYELPESPAQPREQTDVTGH